MKVSIGERIFSWVNAFLLLCFACACIYPLIYVVSASFSDVMAVVRGDVWLFPVGLNVGAYKEVFKNEMIWSGYANSIIITLFGTFSHLLLTTLGAYPLSKKRLMGRKWLNLMVVITIWFGGGMIPTYLNYVQLGLLNTRWALIIGGGISATNVIIMRTFFMGIPDSLEESAFLDGANSWQILVRIYLPLSVPCFATLGLMSMVGTWNAYLWPQILLREDTMQPLAVVIKKIILDTTFGVGDASASGPQVEKIQDYSADMIVYATIVVSMAPMLMIYPFVQKYFKKGIMVGSVKG